MLERQSLVELTRSTGGVKTSPMPASPVEPRPPAQWARGLGVIHASRARGLPRVAGDWTSPSTPVGERARRERRARATRAAPSGHPHPPLLPRVVGFPVPVTGGTLVTWTTALAALTKSPSFPTLEPDCHPRLRRRPQPS